MKLAWKCVTRGVLMPLLTLAFCIFCTRRYGYLDSRYSLSTPYSQQHGTDWIVQEQTKLSHITRNWMHNSSLGETFTNSKGLVIPFVQEHMEVKTMAIENTVTTKGPGDLAQNSGVHLLENTDTRDTEPHQHVVFTEHMNNTLTYVHITDANITDGHQDSAHKLQSDAPRQYTDRRVQQQSDAHNSSSPRLTAAEVDSILPLSESTIDCRCAFGQCGGGKRSASHPRHSVGRPPATEDELLELTTNCTHFKQERRYVHQAATVSGEEAAFPLAYSVVMYADGAQAERLLRAVYRPNNAYCIHVDKKASKRTHLLMRAVAGCFHNVLLAPESVDVVWGMMSVLEAELVCMRHLWAYSSTWRYFINLTGHEFPLKTNLDIVRILKTLNGSNSVQLRIKSMHPERTAFHYDGLVRSDVHKSPPPVNVTIVKGAVHVVVTRAYVDYVLHDNRSLAFLDWLQDTGIPDETFFASLNYSPQLGVPGSYTGVEETGPANPYIARYKLWVTERRRRCHGHYRHNICVFGNGDLPSLASRRELFANKFSAARYPTTLACLEELLVNRTRDDLLGRRELPPLDEYARADAVKHHL